jgi:hypothetical protein
VAGYGKAADTVNAAVGAANPIIGNATNIAGQNLVNTATDVNANQQSKFWVTNLGSDRLRSPANRRPECQGAECLGITVRS